MTFCNTVHRFRFLRSLCIYVTLYSAMDLYPGAAPHCEALRREHAHAHRHTQTHTDTHTHTHTRTHTHSQAHTHEYRHTNIHTSWPTERHVDQEHPSDATTEWAPWAVTHTHLYTCRPNTQVNTPAVMYNVWNVFCRYLLMWSKQL